MKNELLTATIAFLMFQIGENFVAILGLVATSWTIINQYTQTKKRIEEQYGGSFRKYLSFLVRFGGRHKKKDNNKDDKQQQKQVDK